MENPNQIIEEAIQAFISNRTEEQLAQTLSVMRYCLDNELIVSVTQEEGGLTLNPIKTSDGRTWFVVFTTLEEQAKGKSKVQSMFSASLAKVFAFTLDNPDVAGVIINPHSNAMFLEKPIIKVVVGKKNYGLG
ncbi:MAG: SseB family protein [Saccharofermentans sp.]|nr:SseB family protein [Saccharofermentans sp.]